MLLGPIRPAIVWDAADAMSDFAPAVRVSEPRGRREQRDDEALSSALMLDTGVFNYVLERKCFRCRCWTGIALLVIVVEHQ